MSELEPNLNVLPNFDSFVDQLDMDAVFALAPDPIEVNEDGFEGLVMVREINSGSNSPDNDRVGSSSLDSVRATLRWGVERKTFGHKPVWTVEFEESYTNYDSARSVRLDMLTGKLTGEQHSLETIDKSSNSAIKSQSEKIKIANRIAEILRAD